VVIGLALAVLAVGCVGPYTHIASVRATANTEKLTELFVISQVGSKGEVSPAGFEKTFLQAGTACGIRLAMTHVSRLELDSHVHVERMERFGSRYVLTLAEAGGITGASHWTYYDAKLFDGTPGKLVWRADVRLSRDGTLFGDPAERLAMDLLRRLRDDRLIAPCAKLVDPYAAPPAPQGRETYRRR